MTIDYRLLGRFTAELLKSTSLQQQFKVFTCYVHQLGFDGVAYSLIPKMILKHDMGITPIFLVSNDFPSQFLEEYQGEQLAKNDFTIRRIQENKMDMMDWGFYAKYDLIAPKEQKVIKLAQSLEVNNAISIPTLHDDKAIAGASIISRERSESFEKLKEGYLETLYACTHTFHTFVYNNQQPFHHFLPESLIKFTEKEETMIRYKIAGKSMKELGESREGVACRYAEKLARKVRKRYGNIPMNQFIYYMGQLDIL